MNQTILKFPSDSIFKGKEPRTEDQYVSALDIIQACTGQIKEQIPKIWKRIKDNYEEEIIPQCKMIKFKGQGQRETPCLTAKGLIKLLQWIPGDLAKKFREQTSEIMFKYLNADLSLAEEIQHMNINYCDEGILKIFQPKLSEKKALNKEPYSMYIRVYNKYIHEKQKNLKCENIRLSYDIIKFGIASNLQNREISYGNDFGYFVYTVKVPTKENAITVEKLLRGDLKYITVNNSFEYVSSKELASYFNIIQNPNQEILEKRDYFKAAKSLFAKMLHYIHSLFPDEVENYGIHNHPQLKDDNTLINEEIILTQEHFASFIKKKDPEICQEKENNKEQIQEINLSEVEILKELEIEKIKLRNLLNLIKENNPELLKVYTEQEIKNMEHLKKYTKNYVYKYSLDGKFLQSFDSITEAANYYECSTKIVRISCQNKKSLMGFLWRNSADVTDQSDLGIKKIDRCNIDDLVVNKTYDSFEQIWSQYNELEDFVMHDLYRAINLGYVYYGYRWKFNGDELHIGQETGKTGTRKRIAQMDLKFQTVKYFKSLDEATKYMKFNSLANISQAIKNKTRSGGFFWKYL